MNEDIYKKLNNFFHGKLEFGVYRESTVKEEGAIWRANNTLKSIGYLKYQNLQGNHIFLRPDFDQERFFLLCDDLDPATLNKDHKQNGSWKRGRMVVETSPKNFQVWIRSDRPLEKHEKQHYLKQFGSDPGCSPLHRWGRCPGFRNKKEKYRELDYPLSRLIWVDWRYSETFPVVPKPPEPEFIFTKTIHTKGDISRSMYSGQSESETDFRYALALMRRGYSDENVFERIQNERENWEKKPSKSLQRKYLERTIKNARGIIGGSPNTT
jgi:hypothetical protein